MNQEPEDSLPFLEEEDEELIPGQLSYAEIYASAALNGEIIITIPKEESKRVRTGLINLKAKMATKQKEEGLTPDPSVLTFIEREPEDKDFPPEHFIDLSIQLARKSLVKVAKVRIPDSTF